MKAYIGTKIVLAQPEEKEGKPGYKIVYADGYESWSPKDVFEDNYREITDGEIDLVLDDVSETLDDETFKAMMKEAYEQEQEELKAEED